VLVAERTTRALVLLALALVAVLATGAVYLRPSLGSTGIGGGIRARTLMKSPRTPILVGASFQDADHGTAQILLSPLAPREKPTMYSTADGGRSWKRQPSLDNALREGPALFIRQNGSAVQISKDGGRTWRTLADPRPSPLYDPVGAPLPQFLDTENGWWRLRPALIWRTRDGGRTWTELRLTGIPADASSLSLTFDDPTHGFITVFPASLGGSHVIFATDDGGDTWHHILSVTSPIPAMPVRAFNFYRHGTRMVVVVVAVEGLSFSSTANGFVSASGPDVHTVSRLYTQESDDRGGTWGPMRPGPSIAGTDLSTELPAMDGGRLILLQGRRLRTSMDGGASWETRVVVMPEGLIASGSIQVVPGALFVQASPEAAGYVPTSTFPAQARSLLRSRDGGIHWELVPLPRPPA
jgi:photosystem II stability/assembly factor-like uncharacterized protein